MVCASSRWFHFLIGRFHFQVEWFYFQVEWFHFQVESNVSVTFHKRLTTMVSNSTGLHTRKLSCQFMAEVRCAFEPEVMLGKRSELFRQIYSFHKIHKTFKKSPLAGKISRYLKDNQRTKKQITFS